MSWNYEVQVSNLRPGDIIVQYVISEQSRTFFCIQEITEEYIHYTFGQSIKTAQSRISEWDCSHEGWEHWMNNRDYIVRKLDVKPDWSI